MFDTHAPATAYRNIDSELFDRSFKFAFVRNPWDRFASAFHFMKSGTDWPMQQDWARRHIGELDFKGFVTKLRNPLFREVVRSERFFWPQSFWVTDVRGRLMVDQLYRFEELAASLSDVGRRLGLGARPEIPRRRKSDRTCMDELYSDPETVGLVGRLYADDVKRFNYRFDVD